MIKRKRAVDHPDVLPFGGDEVAGPGDLVLDRVSSAEFVPAFGENVYPCRVCGKACVRMSSEDVDALGLNDGGGVWHVVHIACAREERARERSNG